MVNLYTLFLTGFYLFRSFFKKFALRLILCACICTFITACTFAPGMDMKTTKWSLHGPEGVEAPGFGAGVEEVLEIVEITSVLIESLTLDRPNQVIPIELLNYNHSNEYRIGSSDVLSIIVWGQPELIATGGAGSNPLILRQVRGDGTFFFPYAGVVDAAGKTREQIRKDLTSKLGGFFKNPQVDVAVEQYNSKKIILTGDFVKPIVINLTGTPITLNQAIAMAGGPNQTASLVDLQLFRDGQKYFVGDIASYTNTDERIYSIMLKENDHIHLPVNDSNNVYVLGDVETEVVLPVRSSFITLTDALAKAGGLAKNDASGGEVYVIRPSGISKKPIVFKLNAKSPTAYILASKFNLQPQDVVFVGPAEITKWNRIISKLIPSGQIIKNIDDLRD